MPAPSTMVPAAEPADPLLALVKKLGIAAGMTVQEIGDDDDVDETLRDAIESVIGTPMVGYDYEDVVDAVLLWHREDDDDLVDALVDSTVLLADNGAILLLTPKPGRPGHVPPAEVADAAPTSGLVATSTVSAGRDWQGTRLITPKGPRR